MKAVKKAREALGDAAPKFGGGHRDRDGGARGGFSGRGGRGGGVLGKRRRDDGDESSEEDVPEDVKRIPMPRDTPPPIPKEVLDKWYQKRRERMGHNDQNNGPRGTNANMTPLGAGDRTAGRGDGIPERPSFAPPKIEAKTTYESAPVIRDLRKEATAFVPAAVRAKLDKSKGVGGLVEPEEMDKLEKAGYVATRRSDDSGQRAHTPQHDPRGVMMEEVDDEDG